MATAQNPTPAPAPKTETLLTKEEKKQKEAIEEMKKADEERRKEWEKEPALGKLAGGRLQSGKLGKFSIVTEVYVGTGELVVKCSRGEQKAKSGDSIVTLFIEHDDKPDEELIFILPLVPEDADDAISRENPLTNAEYQKLLEARAKREADKAEKPTAPPKTKATA